MNKQAHALVFDFFRDALKGYRLSGAVDYRVDPVLDEYLGDLARCVADGEVTVSEGMVLGNLVVKFASRCVSLPEGRREPR